jgi:tetratricopeptide (TPR) repeat protein
LSFLLFAAALQVAPPVIDPILIPPREAEQAEASESMVRARRLLDCVRVARSDPQAAIAEGARWSVTDGGIEAELCTGSGYEAAEDWDAAASAYRRGHDRALAREDSRATGILANIGRMELRGGDAAGAVRDFTAVLADPEIRDEIRGNVLAERARAYVELEDGNGAQGDLIAAQALLPDDSGIWLLSATLARRQGDLDAAGDFIDRALELDQTDPAILFEAGNIAIGLNAFDIARQAWTQAVGADPGGPIGQAAQRSLDRLAALIAAAPSIPVQMPDEAPLEEDAPASVSEDGASEEEADPSS